MDENRNRAIGERGAQLSSDPKVKQINNFNLNEFFETHEASEYPFIRFVIEVKQPSTILSQIVMTRTRDS